MKAVLNSVQAVIIPWKKTLGFVVDVTLLAPNLHWNGKL
jgi:hypothetical protein